MKFRILCVVEMAGNDELANFSDIAILGEIEIDTEMVKKFHKKTFGLTKNIL